MVALIPARAGSKRVPGKNTRLLAGHPLIAYTIAAAVESGAFSDVMVCTDDDAIFAGVLKHWPTVSVRVRPPVPDDQPDIEWVRDAIDVVTAARMGIPNAFAILRPTSPFRTAETIQRAWRQFTTSEVHSIRAVQPARENPFKMWTWPGAGYPMRPLLNGLPGGSDSDVNPLKLVPLHSQPSQCAPKAWLQNSSLEMAWTYVVTSLNSIAGNKVAPFFTEGHEGFSIDDEDDFATAERLVAEGAVSLPRLPDRQPETSPAA